MNLVFYSFILFGCYRQSSLNQASVSDNESFYARGHEAQVPVRPFGNLSDTPELEVDSIEYYRGYVNSGYDNIAKNKQYFTWIASETRKIMAKKERVGFKHETLPHLNEYYVNKIDLNEKAILLGETRYRDIIRQIEKARYKFSNVNEVRLVDGIGDYNIRGTKVVYDVPEPVTSY